MKIFISIKGEFHTRKRKELFFVGWIKPGKTPHAGVFEGRLNEMAIKEGRKTFLIPGALVLQMLAIQGSRLSTGSANLLENWVCFTKPKDILM